MTNNLPPGCRERDIDPPVHDPDAAGNEMDREYEKVRDERNETMAKTTEQIAAELARKEARSLYIEDHVPFGHVDAAANELFPTLKLLLDVAMAAKRQADFNNSCGLHCDATLQETLTALRAALKEKGVEGL